MDAAQTVTGGRANVVVDMASLAGCACAADRMGLVDLEPPRAARAVVVGPLGLDLSAGASPTRGRHTLRARQAPVAAPSAPAVSPPPNVAPVTAASAPALRAHVAPNAPPPPTTASSRVRSPSHPTSRLAWLIALPLVVIAAATALGIGVYRASAASSATPPVPDTRASRLAPGDSSRPTVSASGELDSVHVADSLRLGVDGAASVAAHRDSVRANRATGPDSVVATDSLARARRQRRSRAPEVIPGWMPQGQRRFTPVDTSAARGDSTRARPRPDSVRSPAAGA